MFLYSLGHYSQSYDHMADPLKGCVRHLHISHNTPCCTPPPPLKKWLKHCPQFLLGRLKYPGGIKIKGYAKVWRANMYYWRSANGEINSQIMDHAVIRLTI